MVRLIRYSVGASAVSLGVEDSGVVDSPAEEHKD
jgi:hypothetical protein